ncbi:DUF1559 family PulG-like putative transporter [Phycisphaera mikurensis]|uniref:DUF1559 domain-containing protein n=1 Tax=Phycisphaera mikurensis (strain NBRC 102666 / KCTC 22515 / FYK2301M01) TaxID=1142394 RepID=I0ID15_PHYMF|nr:DUF1559 domain-containing protein [Phycisphaera mikurensis]MBB6442278.1 prepilin-type N-terminal cleavage/methylation domain-containing protein/prepilin-type processing-associated H-X9-DG protein [Phycisphaera mikurensis]BAM03153.1 hypothetical protein PSMK_09940 [Phycisphaera mikurensis NBRC 102666]
MRNPTPLRSRAAAGPSAARRAFTLIELLVVISIIALLIGILLPALGAARAAGRAAACASNLKQVGIGLAAYDVDYGTMPPGVAHYGPTPAYEDWTFILPDGYMGGSEVGASVAQQRAKVLQCGEAEEGPGGPVGNHYSAHPRLLPDINAGDTWAFASGNFDTYPIERMIAPSELFVVADGVQRPDEGNSVNPLANRTDGNRIFYQGLVLTAGDNPTDLADMGDNTDTPQAQNGGHVRFRHGGDTYANAVFGDGHVENMVFGAVPISMTRVRRP